MLTCPAATEQHAAQHSHPTTVPKNSHRGALFIVVFSTRICAPEIHQAFPRELFRTARKQSELHQELFSDSCDTDIKRIRRINKVWPNAPNNEQVELYFVSSMAASSSNKCFRTLAEESSFLTKRRIVVAEGSLRVLTGLPGFLGLSGLLRIGFLISIIAFRLFQGWIWNDT